MKMKDLRGWFFTFLLLGLDVALVINSIIGEDKMKIIMALLMIPFILVGIFTQFIIRYSDSYILLYRFITVIAYPILIDYADIKNIELVNKYKIVVEAKNKKYSMYVFNASNRYLDLREKWSDYNEKN